jgi:acyl carrier protein
MMPPRGRAEDVLAFVRETLERLDPDARLEALSLDADVRTLELESITLLSLVASLEDRYGVRVRDTELTRITTLRELLALMRPTEATEAAQWPM